MTTKAALMLGRLVAVGGVALLAYGGAVYASGAHAAFTLFGPPSWYDAGPLLVSLRPGERSTLAQSLGVSRLEDVTMYDLSVVYDPTRVGFTLGEDVYFTNTTDGPLPDLVFRVYVNATPPSSGPEVRFVSGSCSDDLGCAVTELNSSAIRVRPSQPLTRGGRLHVKLSLEGALTRVDSSRTNVLAQGVEGLTSLLGTPPSGGDYGLLAVGDGIVSFANFYPVLARRVGQQWEVDEPSKLGDLGSDRVENFRARLEIPASATLAVTGVVTGERLLPPRADGTSRREVFVAAAAIRDFAFTFGDDVVVSERDVRGVKVRAYYLASDNVAGQKVLDVASHALEDFERRFGAYPYTEYDVSEAAIVGGAGGVEFSGLVTAASMLYHPGSGSPGREHPSASSDPLEAIVAELGGLGGVPGGAAVVPDGMLEFVIAHETAHQWWHGLVGSDSRDHPWADEALAQYSAMIYLDDRYGGARAERDGNAHVKMNYQSMRLLGKPDAMADMPVDDYVASIQYAGIVYGKAPYFYAAVRDEVGDPAFFNALRAYVQQYRFREAPGRGVVDSLAAAGGQAKVRPIERRWLDELHGDEDLGRLDLGRLLGDTQGADALRGLVGAAGGSEASELEETLKLLQAGGGAMPGAGAGAPTASGDPEVGELLKMLNGEP